MRYEKRQAKQYARENMRGIWAAIMTSFKANGDIDEPEMRRNVRYYVDQLKIDGIFCGGLVGECWSLTMEERLRVHEIVVAEVAGRIPVMPHVGCNSIRDTVRLVQHAQEIGATYLVCVNPPLNPHSTKQLKDWFGSVCAETDLGLCLFNAKESGLSMTPGQIATLAEIENVIGVKNPQPIEHLDEVRRLAGRTIRVFDPAEFRFLDNVRKHGDAFAELLARTERHFVTERTYPLLDLRVLLDPCKFGAQALDDRCGCAHRHHNAVPDRVFETEHRVGKRRQLTVFPGRLPPFES